MNNDENAVTESLNETSILFAVATAQGRMTDAVLQIMARDKYDGIRAVKWLAEHSKLYHRICEEYQMCCGGDHETVREADKLAKEPQ